ncbi:MAG: hypothetical protein WCD89_06255 [Anaerocolumna sp.]
MEKLYGNSLTTFVSAPINPCELGRNSQYVFALPARYNYAFPEGFEEVEDIIQSAPLAPTEDIAK